MSDAEDAMGREDAVGCAEHEADALSAYATAPHDEPTEYAWDTPGGDQADAADALEAEAAAESRSAEADAAFDETPLREEPVAAECREDHAAACGSGQGSTPDDDDDWFAEDRIGVHDLAADEDDDDWFSQTDDEMMPQLVASPSAEADAAPFYGLDDLDRVGRATAMDETPASCDAAGGDPGSGSGDPRRHAMVEERAGLHQVSDPDAAPAEEFASETATPVGDEELEEQEEQSHWSEPDGSRATVAEALERVALRIRGGHVSLPSDLPSSSEEAALAAVLAALLQSRSR